MEKGVVVVARRLLHHSSSASGFVFYHHADRLNTNKYIKIRHKDETQIVKNIPKKKLCNNTHTARGIEKQFHFVSKLFGRSRTPSR
jgi:hypothetical protein